MYNRNLTPLIFLIAIIMMVSLACNLPAQATRNASPVQPEPAVPVENNFQVTPSPPGPPSATNTPFVTHVDFPSSSTTSGKIVYDVESSGTAPEKRAPYGDNYDIYRIERPFMQNMDYIPDMDIVTYNVRITDGWVYVSIQLIGSNPNNELGIHYGVEIDTDLDGGAEFIIWSNPPYSAEWSTQGVQVFADQNKDTGGSSATRSEAPLSGDGYETKVFDSGIGNDPDLAWVRTNAGQGATIQFVFKESLSGSSFLLGVLADAGLKDVTRMYYNDRFTEEEAGSPEKDEQYYPLKELYAFDNACREAYGFEATGYEPLLCPREEPTRPPRGPRPTEPVPEEPPSECQPPPGGCPFGWAGEPDCYCIPG